MSIFSINYTLFSVFGNDVSLIETISVITGFTNVLLAGKGKVFSFWVGYIYAITLFILFSQKYLYASMILQPISLAIAVYGHYQWTHPKTGLENKNKELKITLLSNKERLFFSVFVSVFSICWGWFMTKLPSISPEYFSFPTKPYLDAFVVGLILLAQFLSAKKKLDCWVVWIIINIANVSLYLLAGLSFLPMVSASYLILAFFGISSWVKQWKEQ